MLLVRRARTRGQLLRRRRPRGRRVRRPGDGILGAARLHRLPGLRELRPVAGRCGGRRRSWSAQQVETAQFLPEPAADRADRRAACATAARSCTLEWPRAEAGERTDDSQSVGSSALPDPEDRRAADRRASSRPTTSGSTRPPTARSARSDRIHGAVGRHPDARCGSSCCSSPSSSSCSCCSSRTGLRARSHRRS